MARECNAGNITAGRVYSVNRGITWIRASHVERRGNHIIVRVERNGSTHAVHTLPDFVKVLVQ